MSKRKNSYFRLDVAIYFGNFLLEKNFLDKLQSFIQKHIHDWAIKLRSWTSPTNKPIDINCPGSMFEVVSDEVTNKGDFYKQLESNFGFSKTNPKCGSIEFHGTNNSLILILKVDERIFFRSGENWLWGNSIVLQICKPKINGVDSYLWAENVFLNLCSEFSPWYGNVSTLEEYFDKNISNENNQTRAIGVDISRYLPGLYWLNFFGEPYLDLIGKGSLLTVPAHESKLLGDGVLVKIDARPENWRSDSYKNVETHVINHLGENYFFSKSNPQNKATVPKIVLQRITENC